MQRSTIVDLWKREAVLEATQKHLLRVLALRFEPPVPPDLVTKIRETADLDKLEYGIDVAVMAGSLFAFRTVMGW